ncbi:hypothetical protein ACF0H5_005799 [Mactra antiquata]
MNIDIDSYRKRIGCFGPGRGFNFKSNYTYNPYTYGSDIHFRAFLMSIIFVATFGGGTTLAKCVLQLANTDYHCPENFIANTFIWQEPSWTPNTYIYNYCQRIFVLSSDIETNPGPLTDKEEILSAIKENSEYIKAEINSLKDTVKNIKSDVEITMEICSTISERVDRIDQKQIKMDKRLSHLEFEVENLRAEKEMLQLDIDSLHDNQNAKPTYINKMVDAIDRLERKHTQNNLRIFGMEEGNSENPVALKQKVMEVIKSVIPDEKVDDYSISDIFRIGKYVAGKCRMVIVKFVNQNVKHKLFHSRDVLRTMGLRISDDLSTKQREDLAELKAQGQTGYYKNGKLCVRMEDNQQSNPRSFVSVKRKLVQTNQNNVNLSDGILGLSNQ